MELTRVFNGVGKVLLFAVPAVYAMYLLVFVLSAGKFYERILAVESSATLAALRTGLHLLLSPGGIIAATAVLLLLRLSGNYLLWGVVVAVWFVANLALSFVLVPMFPVWLGLQAIWVMALLLILRTTQ